MQLLRRALVATTIVGIAVGASLSGTSADAQQASSTVTIVKHVVGTALPGTVFTVRYVCGVPADPTQHFTGSVSFDATGTPRAGNSFTATSGMHCTLVEIEAGGAVSIDFACIDDPVGGACDESGDAFTVGDGGGPIEIDVTNVMPALSDVRIGKRVLGTAPAGTIFQVGYTCEVQGELAHVFSGAVQFDAAGTPLSSDTFTAMSGTHCVVSETEDGGASNVTYLCTDIPRGNSCDGLQTTGASRFTVGNFDGAVEVAVQNEMDSTSGSLPQPVVVEPALTG